MLVVLLWIRFGPGVGARYAAAVELLLISGIARTARTRRRCRFTVFWSVKERKIGRFVGLSLVGRMIRTRRPGNDKGGKRQVSGQQLTIITL